MCSKWHPRRWRHTWIRRAKLSMTRTNCVRIVLIHIILEIPPQIKICGFKSGECAAHSISHCLLISLSLNRSLSQARESFVVWWVTPILPEPLFISIYTSASSQWCPKLHQYCQIAHLPDLNPQIFICGGISRIMCMRTILRQLVNWRQQSQQRSEKSHKRNICESLTILHDVCKCAFNAEDAIWSTFWKEHKNYMQTDPDG